jgi:hypothetical protein
MLSEGRPRRQGHGKESLGLLLAGVLPGVFGVVTGVSLGASRPPSELV